LKKWLKAQPHQPTTLVELQALCDNFTHIYNNERPHRSLNRRTPATVYDLLPKARPASQPDTHYRIRHDRVDTYGKVSLRRAGQMHHIGIGRTHAHTPIVIIIDDLNIRVINHQTGGLFVV